MGIATATGAARTRRMTSEPAANAEAAIRSEPTEPIPYPFGILGGSVACPIWSLRGKVFICPVASIESPEPVRHNVSTGEQMTRKDLQRELREATARVAEAYESLSATVASGDYLSALSVFRDIREMREEIIATLVDAAREDQNASWRDVGEALGLHRSSAQQRFGRPVE